MSLLVRLCFGLLASATNFLARITASRPNGSPGAQIASTVVPFYDGVFEKVGGVWSLVALPTVAGAVQVSNTRVASEDGLTLVCAAANGSDVIVFKRSSTGVSFSTASATLLSLPSGAINSLTVSADGTRLVIGKPSGNGLVVSAVLSGTWQVSSIAGVAGEGLGNSVYLSPQGQRLAVTNTASIMTVYVWTGFPTIPWDFTNSVTDGRAIHWFSDTACMIATSADLQYWSRNGSSTEIVLRWSTSLIALGLAFPVLIMGGDAATVWIVKNNTVTLLRLMPTTFELAGGLPITCGFGRVSRDQRVLVTRTTGSAPFTVTLYER